MRRVEEVGQFVCEALAERATSESLRIQQWQQVGCELVKEFAETPEAFVKLVPFELEMPCRKVARCTES